jgi:hypothetical protein
VLYLQWLSEDTEETVASREDIAKWANGRCNRLIEKFLKIGPAKIRDEPALHFWGFEGMLLYLRQIYGLELLARVINYQTDNGVPTLARDLDLSISYAIKAMPWAPVVVPGTLTAGISSADPGAPDAAWTWAEAGESLVLPPGRACRCWVYLRGDNRYKIRAEVDTDGWRMRGANLAATTASLGLLSATAPETLFYANSEAWYEFQWRNIGDAPAVVQGWSWSPIDKH